MMISALLTFVVVTASASGVSLPNASSKRAAPNMPPAQWRAAMAGYLQSSDLDLPRLRSLVQELYAPGVYTRAPEHLEGLEAALDAKGRALVEASRREDASLREMQTLLSALPLLSSVYEKLPENGYLKRQYLSNAASEAQALFSRKAASRFDELARELAERAGLPGSWRNEDDRRIASEMADLMTMEPWEHRRYAAMHDALRRTVLARPKERVMGVSLLALSHVSRKSIAAQGPIEKDTSYDFLTPPLIGTVDLIARHPKTMPSALAQAMNLLYLRISRASSQWQYRFLPSALDAMVKIARRSDALKARMIGTLRSLKERIPPQNWNILPYDAKILAESWFDWAISMGRRQPGVPAAP